jgi:hypothetical protein
MLSLASIFMKRTLIFTTLLIVILSSASAVGAASLHRELISPREVPHWSRYYIGAAQTKSCPESTFAKPTSRSAIREVFVQKSSETLLLERLSTSVDPAKAFEVLLAHLTKCPKTASTIDGHATFQHIQRAQLGKYSVPVKGYTLSAVVGNATVSGVIAYARKGHVVFALAELSLSPLNGHAFSALLSKALARIK